MVFGNVCIIFFNGNCSYTACNFCERLSLYEIWLSPILQELWTFSRFFLTLFCICNITRMNTLDITKRINFTIVNVVKLNKKCV